VRLSFLTPEHERSAMIAAATRAFAECVESLLDQHEDSFALAGALLDLNPLTERYCVSESVGARLRQSAVLLREGDGEARAALAKWARAVQDMRSEIA